MNEAVQSFKRLWLAVRLPNLPLRALRLTQTEQVPIVVSQKNKVVFANKAASDLGVQLGMDITTAYLLSGCDVLPRDVSLEQKALIDLSDSLYAFTPHIEQHVSDVRAESALLLEIASCIALFGGLDAFIKKVSEHLSKMRYRYVLGLGHSAKAAWILSFHPDGIGEPFTKAQFIERLNQLPIDVLFDYPKEVESLSKMGFTSLGDIYTQIKSQSMATFKKRLDKAFIAALSETFGIDDYVEQNNLFDAPRSTYQPAEGFKTEIELEYPVSNIDLLKPAIEHLLKELCDYLRKRQQQCQYIEWRLSDIYQQTDTLYVASDEPQHHWQLFYDLTLIQLESKALQFEVNTLRLVCEHLLPLVAVNQALDFEAQAKPKTLNDFTLTLAKLKARLGEGAIKKLSYHDSRVPEITNKLIAVNETPEQRLPPIFENARRPTWLLDKPEPIEVKSERLYWHGYLTLSSTPERIIGDWWDTPIARDYFLATRHDNLHVWVYRDLYTKCWFVQGVFA